MRRATRMTMPRTSEAVRDRPGLRARLLPNPFPTTVSLGPPSGDGRSKDYMRQALSQDFCRSSRLGGRKPFVGFVPADQGKAPGPDHFRRPGETPGNAGKWAVMPLSDPALRGGESKLPSPGAVERRRRTENTHATPSTLPPSQKVWEKRRTAAGPTGLGAGTTAFLRNSPGPSVTDLSLHHSGPRRGAPCGYPPRCGAARAEALEVRAGGGPHPATASHLSKPTRPPFVVPASPFIVPAPPSVVPAEAGTSTHSPTSRPYHLHRTHNAPLLPIRHSRVVGNPSPVRGQGYPTPLP